MGAEIVHVTADTVAHALNVDAGLVSIIRHAGRAFVARINGVGVAKFYPGGSRERLNALTAAQMCAPTGLSPIVLHDVPVDGLGGFVVFQDVVGRELRYDDLHRSDVCERLAASLLSLHSIGGDGFARSISRCDPRESSWRHFVTTHFLNCEERFRQRTGENAPTWYMNQVDSALAMVSDGAGLLGRIEASLVHRDMTCRNVVLMESGSPVFIDFDLAAFYDPVFDLVKLSLFDDGDFRCDVDRVVHVYRERSGVEHDVYVQV